MNNHKNKYLNETLFTFGEREYFLGRDAVEGVSIMGSLGSGKTSGSGATIIRAMLKAGYGGLMLTSKPDDLAMLVQETFRGTGRNPGSDVVVLHPTDLPPGSMWPSSALGPTHRFTINLLRYEFERGGQLTANVVDVIHSGLSGHRPNTARDPYWDDALRELLVHAVDLSVMGTVLTSGKPDIRLDDILEIVSSAPSTQEAIESARFKQGRCGTLIRLIDEARNRLSEPRFRDFQLTAGYWLQQFPGLAPETRSSIVGTFTSRVFGLLRSPLRELFCGGTSPEVEPERSLNVDPMSGTPKVIVVNLPVKLYQGVGRFAQMLYKTIWQHAAERRVAQVERQDPQWRPAFLLADEAQYFITPQDAGFQQTARSAMVSTVYLTQNLPNYYEAIGEHATHSFLGNLQTKVLHANGDPATNEWAERVFARAISPLSSEPSGGIAPGSRNYSPQPLIPAIAFTELLKGGDWPGNPKPRRVGAYIFQAGRQWVGQGAHRHYHEFVQT